jgi:N-sulfoglucosamine sulfohydrolase
VNVKNPNIVLITWHDAGRWFGCYGNEHVHTPNVDRLAADGCRFANHFTVCAICSPSRAAITTGRFCQDNGVMFLTNTVNNNRLHRDETHFAARLKHLGYHTALFGVQHECAHEHVSEIMQVDERFATDPWPSADVSAANFEQWLEQRAGHSQPFHAQIGFKESHLGSYLAGNQMHPGDAEHGLHSVPYLEDDAASQQAIGALQGMLRVGDAAIGRILDAIRASGREQDTLIAMCVDHGVGLPRAKTHMYDAGLAVAWLLRWPGVIPEGGTVDAMTSHIDFLPTMCELAGLPIPENLHGVSFAGHVRAERSDEQHDAVFAHMVEVTRCIRTPRYKLIRNIQPRAAQVSRGMAVTAAAAADGESSHLELYDLEKDPNEFTNVVGDPAYAVVRDELDARLWDFLLDRNDSVVNEPVRDEWGAERRRQLEAHCAQAGRPCPEIDR